MTESPRDDAWRPWIGRVMAIMALAMLLYLALAAGSGLDRLRLALSSFPLSTHLSRIIGLVLLGWLLRALRWHYYVRILGWPITFQEGILVFLASFAFTATPGKAGEIVKAGMLRSSSGVTVAETAGVLLVERLGDLLAVLILAMGGLTVLANAWLYLLSALTLVGGITFLVANEWLYRPLLTRLESMHSVPIGRNGSQAPQALGLETPFSARVLRIGSGLAGKLSRALQTGRSLLRPGPFILGLIIAVIAWGCEALAFDLALEGFGLHLSLLASFSIYGISTVIGALSALPGGVGGVEAAMLLLLTAAGVEAGAAVAPVVLIRFATLWLVSLLGFVFMGIWWLKQRN